MDAMFPEADRQVFEYHDGERTVFGDPLAIDDRYFVDMAHEDLDALGEQLGPPKVIDAAGRVAPLTAAQRVAQIEAGTRVEQGVRAAFGLDPFDPATGRGMTSGQVRALWARYQGWKDDLEKKPGLGRARRHLRPLPPPARPERARALPDLPRRAL